MLARQSASSGQLALAQSGFAGFSGGQQGISSIPAMPEWSMPDMPSCEVCACAVMDAAIPTAAIEAVTGTRARLKTARSGSSSRRASRKVTNPLCQFFGRRVRPVG